MEGLCLSCHTAATCRAMRAHQWPGQELRPKGLERRDTVEVRVCSTYPNRCRLPVPTLASCRPDTPRHFMSRLLPPKVLVRRNLYRSGLLEEGRALHLLATLRSSDGQIVLMEDSLRTSSSQPHKSKHLHQNQKAQDRIGALQQCIQGSMHDLYLHVHQMAGRER